MNKENKRWIKKEKEGKRYENEYLSSLVMLLKSNKMVSIYTSTTLILGLTEKNQ